MSSQPKPWFLGGCAKDTPMLPGFQIQSFMALLLFPRNREGVTWRESQNSQALLASFHRSNKVKQLSCWWQRDGACVTLYSVTTTDLWTSRTSFKDHKSQRELFWGRSVKMHFQWRTDRTCLLTTRREQGRQLQSGTNGWDNLVPGTWSQQQKQTLFTKEKEINCFRR